MIFPSISSKMSFEISYSSTLVALWTALLTYISYDGGFPTQALVLFILSCSALTSPHGESRMILPLVFLSERCLANVTSLGHSPLDFYSSALLSYLSLIAARNERNGKRSTTAETIVFGSVGLGLVLLLVKDTTVALAAAVFVIVGYVFFLKLVPVLGENEAVMVSTFVGFYACDTVVNNELGESGRAALLKRPGYLTTYTHIASRATMLSAFYLMAIMSTLSRYCLVTTNEFSKSAERRISVSRVTALFWASFIGILGIMYTAVSYQFQEDALLWLWAYVNSSPLRLNAILLWCTGIPIAVICIDIFTKHLRKTVRRKLFHFVAVVAFTPYAVLDPPFLSFALSTATSVAIIIEIARYYHVYGSSIVTGFVVDHIDNRDSTSGVVRSHIYLLFGLGAAMMLHYRHVLVFSRPTPAIVQLASDILPGIVSLGVVDACAAIVGSTYFINYRRTLGRYLKNAMFTERANTSITHKTTTGTAGGFIAGLLVWTVILVIVYFITVNPSNSKTVAGLGESFADNHAHLPGNAAVTHNNNNNNNNNNKNSSSVNQRGGRGGSSVVISIEWCSPLTWYSYLLVFVCTLTESFMDGVDNLQLPLVVFAAVQSVYSFAL